MSNPIWSEVTTVAIGLDVQPSVTPFQDNDVTEGDSGNLSVTMTESEASEQPLLTMADNVVNASVTNISTDQIYSNVSTTPAIEVSESTYQNPINLSDTNTIDFSNEPVTEPQPWPEFRDFK